MSLHSRIQGLIEEILERHIHRINDTINHGHLKADIHNRINELKHKLVKADDISGMFVNLILIDKAALVVEVSVSKIGIHLGNIQIFVRASGSTTNHEDAYDRAMAGI